MPNTVGQAYVQILPTMNGFSAAVNKGASPVMSSTGKMSGKSFGMSMIGAFGKVLAVAGIGKMITDSFNEGGKLQQSIGGIETLFKKSAGTVEKNAKTAFMRAGISANQYMESTTSFAAALISACGGNTKEAAKMADRAMVDMSDNANKMGTNLESISNAYQSFARGQYQLLDNLKLGYGGTKEEMVRLVSDASKMKKEMGELGVTVDESSLSFSNIVNAISVVQKRLDITGTTAKEASTTLTGAFNMVKASWKDILGNLTTGGDVKTSFSNLFSSIKTLIIGNVAPMAGSLVTSLGSALTSVDYGAVGNALLNGVAKSFSMAKKVDWSGIATSITDSISNALSSAGDTFILLAEYLIRKIQDTDWAQVGTVLSEKFIQIVTSVNWGQVALSAIRLLGFVGNAILVAVGAFFQNIGGNLAQWFTPILEDSKNQMVGLVNTVKAGFKSWASNVVANVIAPFSRMKNTIVSTFNNLKTSILTTVTGVLNGVRKTFNNIKTAITTPVTKALDTAEKGFNKFKNAISKPVKFLKGLKLPKIIYTEKTVLGKTFKIPTDIKWNAKAMNAPYMFTGGTLFGAGEAGDEILYGRKKLMNDIAQAKSADDGEMIALFNEMLALMRSYYPQMAQGLQLDGRRMALAVDGYLGSEASWNSRG